jgi:hypothetical protein
VDAAAVVAAATRGFMSITTALLLALIGMGVVIAIRLIRVDNSSERAGAESYFDISDGSIGDASFSGHSSGPVHDH